MQNASHSAADPHEWVAERTRRAARTPLLVIATLLLATFSTLGITNPTLRNPRLDWFTLATPHFEIHYHAGEEGLARRVAYLCEAAHERLSARLAWTPTQATQVVVSDETDLASGFANILPYNQMTLFVIPPTSIFDHDDWLEQLIEHEYAHVLHLDRSAGAPAFLQRIFGRMGLLFPAAFTPPWIIEGLATYIETDPERGIGRGQSTFFDMMMRQELVDGPEPLARINVPTTQWPVGSQYLYGVHVFQYLQAQYSEERIMAFLADYSDNLVPAQLNRAAEAAFGKNMEALYAEFLDYLAAQFAGRSGRVEITAKSPGRRLTHDGFFGGNARLLPDGRLFYVRQVDDARPTLVADEPDGHRKVLAELTANPSIDVHPQAGVLLSQLEVCDEYQLYYDLYRIPVDGGDLQRLTRCGRYHSAAWSPDGSSIAAVRTVLGQTRMDLLDAAGVLRRTLWQGDGAEMISQLDWSSDGSSVVASVRRGTNRQVLELFSLRTGAWARVTDSSGVNELAPQFSADGRGLVYSADHDGTFNIYHLDLASAAVSALSNVSSGAFKPTQVSRDGPLVYLGYHHEGYDYYRLDRPQLEVRNRLSPVNSPATPSAPNNSKLIGAEGDIVAYSPYRYLVPTWWSPTWSIEDGDSSGGFVTSGRDPLGVHQYSLATEYNWDHSIVDGYLFYRYSNRFWSFIDFSSDQFETLDASSGAKFTRLRKSTEVQLGIDIPWTRWNDSWQFSIGASWEKQTDHDRPERFAPIPDFYDNIAGISLAYGSARRFWRSNSLDDGRQVRAVLETSDIGDGSFAGEVYSLDWREYLALTDEQVLALRLVQARGTGRSKPFVLGDTEDGFSAGAPFNRRDYALRGYDQGLPGLFGRRMRLASAEWRFPLARPERGWMAPPVGMLQVSGRVFVSAGAAWDRGSRPDDYFRSAGLELVADLNTFYQFPFRVKLGFARGIDRGGDDEVYLQLATGFD